MASTGRLVHKADFERLLAVRSRKRSAHFAVHHVPGAPSQAQAPVKRPLGQVFTELSTGSAPTAPSPVDDLPAQAVLGDPQKLAAGQHGQAWLACVVPKRHAKRAVTRNLLKRQMRSSFDRHRASLPAGLWLLRLSAGFVVAQFPSARSAALAQAARQELDGLLLGCKPAP
jgi:ribonuclease P protein component